MNNKVKKCPICGNLVAKDAEFCETCGWYFDPDIDLDSNGLIINMPPKKSLIYNKRLELSKRIYQELMELKKLKKQLESELYALRAHSLEMQKENERLNDLQEQLRLEIEKLKEDCRVKMQNYRIIKDENYKLRGEIAELKEKMSYPKENKKIHYRKSKKNKKTGNSIFAIVSNLLKKDITLPLLAIILIGFFIKLRTGISIAWTVVLLLVIIFVIWLTMSLFS